MDAHTDAEIMDILGMRRVAVVGISKKPNKAAHYVPKYMGEHGYEITPVNPNAEKILDKKCHHDLSTVRDVDVVNVFRPSDQVLPVVREAIKLKPKVIWLQEGIHNEEAEREAREAGIDVVFDRCMMAEHGRLK